MITIVGAGKVGSAAAFDILKDRIIELKQSKESQLMFEKSIAKVKTAIETLNF